MPDMKLSGGCRWNDLCVADVTMDPATGDPLTCCNPVTGVCLGGGGGTTATVTFVIDNEESAAILVPAIIERSSNTYLISYDLYGAATLTVPIIGDGTIGKLDVDEVVSHSGDVTIDEALNCLITGDCEIHVNGYHEE